MPPPVTGQRAGIGTPADAREAPARSTASGGHGTNTGNGLRSRLSAALRDVRARCRHVGAVEQIQLRHSSSSFTRCAAPVDYRGYPSSDAPIVLIQSRQSLQVASVIAIVANISVCPSGPLSRHVGHSDSGTPARHKSQGPASVASLAQFGRSCDAPLFRDRSPPRPVAPSTGRCAGRRAAG